MSEKTKFGDADHNYSYEAVKGCKLGDADYNYITEVEESLVELKARKCELENKAGKITRMINGIGWFSHPVQKIGEPISNIFEYSWYRVKSDVAREWLNPFNGKECLSPSTSDDLFLIGTACAYGILILSTIMFQVHDLIGIHWTQFLLLGACLWEIICEIIGKVHYIFIPNRVNKKNYKKQLKALNAEIALVDSELKTKENLVETYKLSTINPNQIFGSVKGKTISQLKDMVNHSRSEVLPKIHSSLVDSYTDALNKCDKILEYANSNATIVTEISKIYNIYLTEIEGLLLKNNDWITTGVVELLDNFNSYLDRKINKFNAANETMIKVDISALNKIFLEEED